MLTDFKVLVPGTDFELVSNQVYHIKEVSDSYAPEAFKKEGISKAPLPGISQGIIVPHDGMNWNTGFNELSSCYRSVTPLIRGKIYKTLSEKLIPKIQELVSGDITDIKDTANGTFDDFKPFISENGQDVSRYEIKGGNMYDTSDPLQFLALWWALLGKQVLPPNSEGYSEVCFVLVDKVQTTSVSQDREYEETEAKSDFLGVLKKGNKAETKHLQNVLAYIGLPIDLEETEIRPATSMFNKWCDKGSFEDNNAGLFLETFKYFSEEDNKEELIVYLKLIEHIKSGKVAVERNDIIVEGQNLGSDKKTAAKKITTDKELHKAFLLIE